MPEQTITGICTEIAQKPGSEWVEFHIDGGGRYPVRLSTKLLPLIELGKAVGSQLATWTYNEAESDKINPNSGKPYINRYLERVEVGGTVPEPDHPAPENWQDASVSPTSAPVLGTNKDRLIVRQTCLKAAAELHAGGSADDVLASATKFERWVVLGILEDLPF